MLTRFIRTKYKTRRHSGAGIITATHVASNKSQTIEYPHEVPGGSLGKHQEAVMALAKKMGWNLPAHTEFEVEEVKGGWMFAIIAK